MAAFARRAEMLNRAQRSFVQVQVLAQGRRVSRLLADDLSARVLDNAWSMNARLLLGPDIVFLSG